MQVIFLPSGSGPSRNYQLRLALVGAAAAGILLAIGAGGGFIGYHVGSMMAALEQPASPPAKTPHHPVEPARIVADVDVTPAILEQPAVRRNAASEVQTVAAMTALLDTVAEQAAEARAAPEPEPQVVNHRIAEKFTVAGVQKLTELQEDLREQRVMLNESRRRLGDHVDTLGQRLGEIQAAVSRLNALGQRLTDMAGLDREEFSFDNPPALGGPERPGPWEQIREPEFTETLHLIEIALREKENELEILEALLTDRELHQKQYPQGWPAAAGGWMSSGFGYRNDPFTGRRAFHEGVDIAARSGSEIRAMAAGVVSFSGQRPGYGLMIEINHGNGYETRYAHAKALIAKVGERVEKGDAIALVGSTGRSTGSHVHIEVMKNGKVVNPHEYLKSSG